jgi:hypothetical protein
VAGVGEVGAAKLVPVLAKASRAINLPGRLPFIRKGYAAMGAAGGGLISAVTQVASDALDGRVSSPTDVLAATGGGIAGGRLAVAGRPVLGAAIGAGGAETLQDLANGGDFSVVDAQHSTNAGAYGGRVFKVAGEHLSNAAPIKTKGAIGDTLTHIKSLARGEYIPFLKTPMGNRSPILPGLIGGKAGSQKAIELPSRAKTVADKVTYWDRALEAKFGPYAKLSKAQREAWDRLGPLFYQPDQWLPKHVGELAAGLVGSAAGQHASDGRQ